MTASGLWYKNQVDHLSDALTELLNDEDPSVVTQGISDAIAEWEDYHEKELAKWKRLRTLLNLEADK